jgi:HEAT repeat protein
MSSLKRVERLLAKGRVGGLCRLLRHRDAFVRRRAAQALGELGDVDGVPCLARALRRDRDQYVLRWAIDSLHQIGSPEAVDALTEAAFSTRAPIAETATQALTRLDTPSARSALRVRDILLRNDWDALAGLDESGHRALAAVLHSEGYHTWPSARRQRTLEIAVRLGVTPPTRYRRELAESGLFASGVHTLGDLLRGLRGRSPATRTAAAERLGQVGYGWVRWLLYPRFRREVRRGERGVAAALARSLDMLGDPRPLQWCRQQLFEVGGQPATEAAYLLAEVGTPAAVEALFEAAAEPPPPPAYRNVPLAMSALEAAGPPALDALRGCLEDDSAGVRRLMVDVVARSGHPEMLARLADLARDDDPGVARAALDALADLNTADAARTLYELAGEVHEAWLVRSLTAITDPTGPALLRRVAGDATTVGGVVLGGEGQPVAGAGVQVLQEQAVQESISWRWGAVSARAHTDGKGAFSLALAASGAARLRIKVVMPPPPGQTSPDVYEADLPLVRGRANRITARLDRFFDRLLVTVEPLAD